MTDRELDAGRVLSAARRRRSRRRTAGAALAAAAAAVVVVLVVGGGTTRPDDAAPIAPTTAADPTPDHPRPSPTAEPSTSATTPPAFSGPRRA